MHLDCVNLTFSVFCWFVFVLVVLLVVFLEGCVFGFSMVCVFVCFWGLIFGWLVGCGFFRFFLFIMVNFFILCRNIFFPLSVRRRCT